MFRHILLATDFSEHSGVTRALALSLCREQEARLTVLHVHPFSEHHWEEGVLVPSPRAEEESMRQQRAELQGRLDDYLAPIRAAGIEPDVVVADGRASVEILREAEERGCDLIVMGSHGRRGLLEVLLGGTAARVSRDSKVPVLIVGGSATA